MTSERRESAGALVALARARARLSDASLFATRGRTNKFLNVSHFLARAQVPSPGAAATRTDTAACTGSAAGDASFVSARCRVAA